MKDKDFKFGKLAEICRYGGDEIAGEVEVLKRLALTQGLDVTQLAVFEEKNLYIFESSELFSKIAEEDVSEDKLF